MCILLWYGRLFRVMFTRLLGSKVIGAVVSIIIRLLLMLLWACMEIQSYILESGFLFYMKIIFRLFGC